MVQTNQNSLPSPAAAGPATQVRPARLGDIDLLADILTTSFYDHSGWQRWFCPFIRIGIHEDLKQRLRSQSPRYACLAAVSPVPLAAPLAADAAAPTDLADAIAGTIEAALRQPWPWQGDRHVYISNLAVGHRFRRQGIALVLLQSCEQLARRWNVSELRLHVMEDNLAAQALYRKAGFSMVQAEESPAVWMGLQARRLLLRKTLVPPLAQP
ncbi:MAG TPA: GNAT family N-acetyltransferase [Nodosilinea sp.]|nr:GNAT family N-acetyltransferase [Nodosilinea sp.]